MAAYYNERDPYAAAWLRNLISAGHIAPGDVDERSIEDVLPIELAGYTQCHFFAGIGVWSYALRRAGWPDDRPVWTGSCPCQPFSAAGKGGGFADERHLWPAWFHLIGVRKPAIVLGEQVASKDGLAWFDLVHADMEAAGYAVAGADLCAAGVGAPHIRQRLWFVGVADAAHEQHDGAGIGRARRWPEHSDGGNSDGLADAVRGRAGHDTGEGLGAQAATDGQDGNLPRQRLWAGVEGSPDDLEHATLDGRQQWRAEPGERSIERGRGSERVGDTDDAGLSQRECDGRVQREAMGALQGEATERGIDAGRLANSRSERREGEPVRLQSGQQGQAVPEDSGRGADGRLADAERRSTERHGFKMGEPPSGMQGAARQQRLRDDAGHGGVLDRPGPTNGHWRAADWLFCRDGKWRPVEPGTFPLADGVANRVGRLRAYGNAIVAEAAQAFIESVM